jgi:hypothetical protein
MCVLSDFIAEIDAEFDYTVCGPCENTVGTANSCPECCQNRYFNGDAIEYDCEQFRKAYVMRYLPVHVHENFLALNMIPEEMLGRIAEDDDVNVLSLGGGPGSDILAFKKFFNNWHRHAPNIERLTIYRVDLEETWNDLASQIIHLIDCAGVEIDHKRITNNVLRFRPRREGMRSHFICLSYLLSELRLEDIPRLARKILNFAADVAAITINDRNQDEVREKAELLLDAINAERIAECSDSRHCGVTYDEALKDRVMPKLMTTSIRYAAVITQ